MPYFDDEEVLVKHKNYKDALKKVEAALAAHKGGTSKVYRIDIPGKEETVFGVALTLGESADKFIMNEIDFKQVKSSAHLPYEMVVTGKKVIALSAKFRIAINFPELSMMGDNSFMKIMSSPGAINSALTQGAGGN